MEIKQLEYFKTIVEEGTISGAARALHMTQPPLSYQMKMLEEELSVSLFVRGTKKITLTEAGKLLYKRATSLLTMADITKKEVIKAGQSGTIHMGLTASTVNLIADHMAHFAQIHPEIHFDILDGTTFTLKSQLESRVLDISTLRTPVPLTGFNTKLLAKEELLVMTSSDANSKNCDNIQLEELATHRIILSRRYRNFILSAFEARQLHYDIYYECEDSRTALSLAERGLGTAILPASMSQLSHKVIARRVAGADLVSEILLVWHQEDVSPEVTLFLEEFE